MRLEGYSEREHGFADLVVLLAVVCLALVTWSYLADVAAVSLWRTYTSVGLTVLFSLAALTRHPGWAAAIRLLLGAWLIAAPYVLSFAGIPPALWAYLLTGSLLMALSIPAITARYMRRNQHDLLFRLGTANGL